MSSAIDVASPDEIVRVFRACDAQLFAGYAGYPGLMDEETIRVVDQLTAVAAEIVSFSKDSAVVVSGAGTSSRIAFQVVLCFNAVLKRYGLPPCFHFLIAGGLPALLK
ncbi:unnamed protein product, partial [Closterium sp. Naga37s-1]